MKYLSRCYNNDTHDFYPADSADECQEGYFFTNANWDCYGLLMLTYDAASLCSLAADAWVADCVYGDSAGRNFYLMDASFMTTSPSALKFLPFSGITAVSQYLSVIPSQPFELLIVNFSFSMSS